MSLKFGHPRDCKVSSEEKRLPKPSWSTNASNCVEIVVDLYKLNPCFIWFYRNRFYVQIT